MANRLTYVPYGLGPNPPEEAPMYFVGAGIFAVVAILCVVAYTFAMRQRRRYEETGELGPEGE
jgi:hypothetical protein